MNMEELLTPEEISLVLQKCATVEPAQLYLDIFTSKKLDISYISKKGLIFVHGNDDTGKEHIVLRHSITSRQMFERGGKLDNPSKFTIAPIEYPSVADALYLPENLNLQKNRAPEKYDCYVGRFKYSPEPEMEYTLILYAGTKIVHTFYLSSNSKPHNKKVKLPLRQGFSGSTENLMTNIEQHTYSYFCLADIKRFSVTLISNPHVQIEKWYLTMHDKEENPVFSHHLYDTVPEYFLRVPWKMNWVDFHDNSKLDKIIENIMKGKYEFEKDFQNFCDYCYVP